MLLQRMMRAARLDSRFYEEVEHDLNATSQAATVVAIVAVANGLGGLISVLLGEALARAVGVGGNVAGTGASIFGLVLWMLFFVIGWVIWAYLTYFIGTSVFKGTATPGEMMRTLGFATSPLVLGVLWFIPCIGWLIWVAGAVWMLVAGVIAVRQALDFDTGQAFITVLLAAIPFALLWGVRIGLEIVGNLVMSAMR
jgi:hypothetical protein